MEQSQLGAKRARVDDDKSDKGKGRRGIAPIFEKYVKSFCMHKT